MTQHAHCDGDVFRSARTQALLAAIATICLALLLRTFPPSHYSFYPACPLHSLFGLTCPGCGATRAIAAMLHADFAEALRQNALIVLCSPLPAIVGVMEFCSAFRWNRWTPIRIPPAMVSGALAMVLLFGLARNLDFLVR